MRVRKKAIGKILWLWAIAASAIALAYGSVKPAPAPSITETIEWTWAQRPTDVNPALPNVLLLGDSITRGYYAQVAQRLDGRANCYLFATSASAADPRLAQQLAAYFRMVQVHFRVIHFNNGMHGWGYTEKQYARGLAEMVADLRGDDPGARLIWADTTPVLSGSPDSANLKAGGAKAEHRRRLGPHGNGATNPRIEARNAAARKIMLAQRIPVDDQFVLMSAHADLHSGRVHYTKAGSEIQAEQAVKVITPLLEH